MSSLPPRQTPLYNHPLPALEQWLCDLGACRDGSEPCLWDLEQPCWRARIELDVEELKVSWYHDSHVTVRLFPYGLSRADVESAILAGP
jgi:hypothetical protein